MRDDWPRLLAEEQRDARRGRLQLRLRAWLRDRYGRTPFEQACLLARRLVEAGVTFVEITNSAQGGETRLGWDCHQNTFVEHHPLAALNDPAYSALIADLKDRGMLAKTLVIGMGEFGRTPSINPKVGRPARFPAADDRQIFKVIGDRDPAPA
jgi:hypothetical protein